MRLIIAKNKEQIKVDNEDYLMLCQYRWHINTYGYAVHTVTKKDPAEWQGRYTISMHRIIMNPSANMVIDHINGDKLDNRRSNLRICTQAENVRNQKKTRYPRLSHYKGVSKDHGCWRARITKDRVWYCLGYFRTEEAAAQAYNQAAQELFGEYARLNIIPVEAEEIA